MGKEARPKERRKGILDEMDALEARRSKRKPKKVSDEDDDLDLGRIS